MTLLLADCLISVPAYSALSQAKLPQRKAFIWPNPVSYVSAIQAQPRMCELIDLHEQQIPYEVAWCWQKELVRKKKAQMEEEGDCRDTLIVLQHPPVYTLGTASSEDNLNFDFDNPPFDIYRTERGGQVTYHGPGQLVMYPIINLRNHKMDLHWYLRTLEEIVIRALSSTFSIEASRIDGLTGVWVGQEKVAAVGIRVSQWITYHGLALNVTTDLTPFKWIVPCGIRDRQVGSIKGLLRKQTDDASLIHNTYKSLITEFSQVFELEYLHETTYVPESHQSRLSSLYTKETQHN